MTQLINHLSAIAPITVLDGITAFLLSGGPALAASCLYVLTRRPRRVQDAPAAIAGAAAAGFAADTATAFTGHALTGQAAAVCLAVAAVHAARVLTCAAWDAATQPRPTPPTSSSHPPTTPLDLVYEPGAAAGVLQDEDPGPEPWGSSDYAVRRRSWICRHCGGRFTFTGTAHEEQLGALHHEARCPRHHTTPTTTTALPSS